MLIWRGCLMAINRVAVAPARHSDLSCLVLPLALAVLVLAGLLLGWLVHPAFLGLSAFVGAGLVFAGITDTCGMGMMLARMPWNQVKDAPAQCCEAKEACS